MNTVGEYQGYPVIILNAQEEFSISYGKTKCKLIIDNIHRIKGYLAQYPPDVVRRMKKADTPVPPIDLPNGNYNSFKIGLYNCKVIADNYKDIERFYNTGEI